MEKKFLSIKEIFLCGILFILIGCNQSFQPIKKTDQFHFSIYGYLDAAADTQWVRVSPPRDQLVMPPVLPDMKVTLEDVNSGSTVVMNDSLFQLPGGINFVNAWTTMDIKPGHRYRLEAKSPDKTSSSAEVTIPPDFPTPLMQRETHLFGEPDTYAVIVEGADHLADVRAVWYVKFVYPGFQETRKFVFPYRANETINFDGAFRVVLEPAKEKEQILSQAMLPDNAEMQVLHRQVFVAIAGPEWIDGISSLDDIEYSLPGKYSDIKNGLGYLVGVNSKWIPYKSCRNDKGEFVACPAEAPYW